MTPKRFRSSSFWKAILVSGEQGGKRAREPFVEILEPRVLFSAAPVAMGEVSEETTVQVARPTQSAEGLAESRDAGGSDAIPELELVSLEVVESLAAEARKRWIDSGISAEQVSALDAIRYNIATWVARASEWPMDSPSRSTTMRVGVGAGGCFIR